MTDQLKNILYIDDEDDLLAIVKLALESIGDFTVNTCSTAADGVKVAKEWKPDLIMLDVMMPVVDGPATLKMLRQEGIDQTPVVFITARSLDSQMADYRAMGAVGTIPKPFDPIGLAGQVEELWERSHA